MLHVFHSFQWLHGSPFHDEPVTPLTQLDVRVLHLHPCFTVGFCLGGRQCNSLFHSIYWDPCLGNDLRPRNRSSCFSHWRVPELEVSSSTHSQCQINEPWLRRGIPTSLNSITEFLLNWLSSFFQGRIKSSSKIDAFVKPVLIWFRSIYLSVNK